MTPRAAQFARSVVGAGLAVLLSAGCAPPAPDHSSWTDQAHLALEDVSSEVATASLLLRLEAEDKVPGKYQQVVAQDAESAVGVTLARFGGKQPEPRDDAEYGRVTALMSDASDLLAEVRIAIVRRDTGAYPDLRDQLTRMQDELTRAQERLR